MKNVATWKSRIFSPQGGRVRTYARRPRLVQFLVRRYVVSLVLVSLATSAIMYSLLQSAQKSAIELSYEATEEFLVNSVLYQVRNYEFESLRQSLVTFQKTLQVDRIEVTGTHGKALADAGVSPHRMEPDAIVPIISTDGARHGNIKIWYGEPDFLWLENNKNASNFRFLSSALVFLAMMVGYAVFFYILIHRHVNEPIAALTTHINASQDRLSSADGELQTRYAGSIPEHLTRFSEIFSLGSAYTRLEQKWIKTDDARSVALDSERYQRSILTEVLHLARITVVLPDRFGHITFVGTPLEANVKSFLTDCAIDEKRFVAKAKDHALKVEQSPHLANENTGQFVYEMADCSGNIWTLHPSVIRTRKAIILREITQERRLEDALVRNDKLKAIGMLSSSIAHDFNNILATIFTNLGCRLINTK